MFPTWAIVLGILTSPIKLVIWLANRLATWLGIFFVWKKLEGSPNRKRHFIMWMVVINTISFFILLAILRFIAMKRMG